MASPKVIDELFATMHATCALFDQPAAVLDRSYGKGKWTLRQILVHLSDCETVYVDRLRRLAAEKKPVLMAFEENDWAAKLFYPKRDLGLARQQFEIARRNIIEMVRTLPESVARTVGVHSEAGAVSFGQVLEKIIWHTQHHLEQTSAIVAGKTWKPKKKKK